MAAAASAPCPGDWYANLLSVERRKCLLVTHAGTLFSVFVPDVRVAELRPLGAFVAPRIAAQLAAEGFGAQDLGPLDATTATIAATADRSVLGCMNDLALVCERAAADTGGLAHLDLAALHRRLQRNLSSARDYVPAVDLVADWATQRHSQDERPAAPLEVVGPVWIRRRGVSQGSACG